MKKKSNFAALFLVLVVCFSTGPIQAQEDAWVQMTGPYGGSISCLVAGKNGCVCAATYSGGLYVSNDNGNSWTEKISEKVTCLAVNKDGKLYAGSAGLIYFSTDDGKSWLLISSPSIPENWVNKIAIDSSNTIYLGVGGLYKSVDDCKSWTQLSVDASRCLTTGPNGVVFAGNDYGISRSLDYGNHWTAMNEGLSTLEMRSVVLTNSGNVLVSTYGGGVYRSTIKGSSWEKVLDVMSLSLAIDSSGNIFVASLKYGSGSGIYRSEDEGLTWIPVNTGLGNLSVESIAAGPGNLLFAGTNGMGVFRSTNQGLSWEETNEGLDNVAIPCVNGNSKNDIFVGCHGGGLKRTSDGGKSWEKIDIGLNCIIYDIGIDQSENIYLSNEGGTFKSVDNGKNWESLSNNGSKFAFCKNGYIILQGGSSVEVSVDSGNTWEQKLAVNPDLEVLFEIAVNDSNYIFVGATPGLYRSKNLGSTWDKIYPGSTENNVYRLYIGNDGSLFAAVYSSSGYHNILRSDDNGDTWTNAGNGFPVTGVDDFTSDTSGCIYAATFGAGVYCTCNNGASWVQYNNGLKRLFVGGVYIDKEGYLYAGTLGGDNNKKSSSDMGRSYIDRNTNPYIEDKLSSVISGGYLFRTKANGVSAEAIFFLSVTEFGSPLTGQTVMQGPYIPGSTVERLANTYTGYRFVNWTENGEIVSSDSVYSFVITANRKIVANYFQLTGVDEHKMPFSFYPNPATNKISIICTGKSQGETRVSIFSMNGQLLLSKKFLNTDGLEIDVSMIPEGIYLLKIQNNEGVETQKLVLQ